MDTASISISHSILRTLQAFISFTKKILAVNLVLILSLNSQAETLSDLLLDKNGAWDIQILTDTNPARVGHCSMFTYGGPDPGCSIGLLRDNNDSAHGLGSDLGKVDGFAGVIKITKTGRNTFIIDNFQVDPYLGTAGGSFGTQIADLSNATGSISDAGELILDLTGRTAQLQFFATTLGEQRWNIDNSGIDGTNLYELFTTATSSNAISSLEGRRVGDINDDGILDAVLVSLGEVGSDWGFFVGTPYIEVFNVQLVKSIPSGPGITVNIALESNIVECNVHNGAEILLSATVGLSGGALLDRLEWYVDGESIGSGNNIESVLSLGSHQIMATAYSTTGQSDTHTQSLTVRDTTAPELDVSFVNTTTGEVIEDIDERGLHRVSFSIVATDTCDPEPVTRGTVVPLMEVAHGDSIRVFRKREKVELPVSALQLMGYAVDAANRSRSQQTVLSIK